MKKLLKLILAITFIIIGFSSSTCKREVPEKTLSGAYWTSPIMSVEQAKSLARHALLVVDMENMVNNKKSLLLLKKINPRIKLICYSNPMEFFSPMKSDRPIQDSWLKESLKHRGWELKTGEGKNATYWPGMKMMNMSSLCPLSQGKKYSEWLAQKLLAEVLNDPIWDGYFIDNGGGNISWTHENSSQIDIDGDGISDDPEKIDKAWYEGLHSFLTLIREAKGSNFILIANKGSVEMMDLLDGRMFESWPNDYLGDKRNGGWDQCLINAHEMIEQYQARYTIFQVKNPGDLEFALASARLLDSVYVFVGQDNRNFYDIFLYDPGKSQSVAMDSVGIFYRDFERGRIIVSPGDKKVNFKSYNPM